MKKFLAGLVIGVTLALTGATAAHSDVFFWERGGKGYICRGIDATVFCNETKNHPAYQIGFVPGYVSVAYNDKLVYFCKRRTAPRTNCAIVP